MDKINNIEHDWGFELIWADTDNYYSRILIIKENELLPEIYIFLQLLDQTILILSLGVQ